MQAETMAVTFGLILLRAVRAHPHRLTILEIYPLPLPEGPELILLQRLAYAGKR